MVPAFTGLGAPYWQPQVRGLFTGLTLDTDKDHIVTAVLQAVGYQTEELLNAMAADGAAVTQLRIDGGMVVNDHLCQFLADVLDVEVQRPQDVETTALGAAVLAKIGAGHFANLDEAADAWALDRAFLPEMPAEVRQQKLAGYASAVARARLET